MFSPPNLRLKIDTVIFSKNFCELNAPTVLSFKKKRTYSTQFFWYRQRGGFCKKCPVTEELLWDSTFPLLTKWEEKRGSTSVNSADTSGSRLHRLPQVETLGLGRLKGYGQYLSRAPRDVGRSHYGPRGTRTLPRLRLPGRPAPTTTTSGAPTP